MNRVFGDTSFFVAILSPTDQRHTEAIGWLKQTPCHLITTEFVLVELANALSRRAQRTRFARILETLRASSPIEILPATHELFEAGFALFRQRPDKNWSLTDCTSFVVMHERAITEALTADHHFEQAGFLALLK